MSVISDLGAELNLLCRAGHTAGPFEFTWTDEAGNAVPIGSAAFESNVYQSKDDLTVIDTLTVTVTDGPAGVFEVVLPQDHSVPLGKESFYILSATIDGVKTPLVFGQIEVRPG